MAELAVSFSTWLPTLYWHHCKVNSPLCVCICQLPLKFVQRLAVPGLQNLAIILDFLPKVRLGAQNHQVFRICKEIANKSWNIFNCPTWARKANQQTSLQGPFSTKVLGVRWPKAASLLVIAKLLQTYSLNFAKVLQNNCKISVKLLQNYCKTAATQIMADANLWAILPSMTRNIGNLLGNLFSSA